MVRNYKRKTQTGLTSSATMKSALRDHLEKGYGIRQAAKVHNIPYPTFRRYVMKIKEGQETKLEADFKQRQVFTEQQEKELCEYLVRSSQMGFGLSSVECRKLAFELGLKNDIKMPRQWKENETAGKDWFHSFRKRNPDITLRKPENCSLTRATSFNAHNVKIFYDNLQKVYDREPRFSDPSNVFNLDETATTTVPTKTPNVIAAKNTKQVSQATSGEKGVLVTTCCIINAAGGFLPPAMVFPRVKFVPKMLKNGIPNTLGLANKTGWMNAELFEKTLEHFIKYSNSSLTSPKLLILDNHKSHLSIRALDLAKRNGITLLTLPPHTSHKLQPLDITCYYPFKAAYNRSLDAMIKSLKLPLTIYEVAECVHSAHDAAITPKNIKSGFEKSGIFPFNPQKFSASDFLGSDYTNRDMNTENTHNQNSQQMAIVEDENVLLNTPARNNNSVESAMSPNIDLDNVPLTIRMRGFLPGKSPEDLRGYPKAKPRKQTTRGRKRGRSIIATDSPQKN